jgi:radical SAM-linked protein
MEFVTVTEPFQTGAVVKALNLLKALCGWYLKVVNLLSFQRPSRYINNELHSIHKDAFVKVALAFPDIYDVGMSHLGLKILYHIINGLPYAAAERVFSPWIDLEEAMKKKGILLGSLESNRPLRDFDIVGFSLQYELSYTTVLNMLHLGGIPLRSEERLQKKEWPVVIAGGPCTLNPYPMAPFIDAFLVGDGEDAVREIVDIYRQWKKEGDGDKRSLLSSLSGVEGVFVPSLGRDREVRRRIISSLEDSPYPESPVLPFAPIIHDRVNIEIARGCSMGCRFCQAGMAYRPVRERSVERVLELAAKSLKNTGYEDVSFTSLSSGDYSCLHGLLREFNNTFARRRISISLPSLRVASVNSGILGEIRSVRKTGFTIAPEAGTDRLRAVINKDFTEETYVNALDTLFREGWHNLKLYFMTGLPTETDADIEAIPEMVHQAIRISRKLAGRHATISVGVSSFVPKPHTPFQWFGQNDIGRLREKNGYLKKAFLRRGVKFKGHDEHMSLLEAVFARGDERLAGLIEKAWSSGCRLDAWTETFDFEKWRRAMEETGINAAECAAREYDGASVLPWENIKTGVTKEYLWREYGNALSGRFTTDCRKQCHACGLKCVTEGDASPVQAGRSGTNDNVRPVRQPEYRGIPLRVRMEYSKTGSARYLSHLELMTAIVRGMRRADFPLQYSSGFHPSPKVSFGPALPVGTAGMKEYLDFELVPPFDIDRGLEDLNGTFPKGLRISRMAPLYGKEKSLNSFVVRYGYRIRREGGLSDNGFLLRDEVLVKRKETSVDVRKMVEELRRADLETFVLTVCDQGEVKVRLDELLPEIFGVQATELDITRIAMFGWDRGWIEPMEGARAWAARS